MAISSSVRNRVSKLRQRRRQAGLKRVEVVVQEDHVDALKAYAAQLREGSQSGGVALNQEWTRYFDRTD